MSSNSYLLYDYIGPFILLALVLAIVSLIWKNKYSFILNIISLVIMIWQIIMLYLLGAEMVEIISVLTIFTIVNGLHFVIGRRSKQ